MWIVDYVNRVQRIPEQEGPAAETSTDMTGAQLERKPVVRD